MAQYNEILVGRFNRFIQKYFGMKGRPPAPQLSGDIQMQHSFFSGNENRFIEGWNLWGAAGIIAANAANVNSFQFTINGSKGIVAVVEKVTLWTTGVAEEIDISVASLADLSTIVPAAPRDTRILLASGSSAVVSQQNVSVGSGFIFSRLFIAPNQNNEWILFDDQEFALTPNFAIRFLATVANQNLGYTIFWRERPLEEGEVK